MLPPKTTVKHIPRLYPEQKIKDQKEKQQQNNPKKQVLVGNDPFTKALQAAQSKNIRLQTTQSLQWFNRYVTKTMSGMNTYKHVQDTDATTLVNPGSRIYPGQLILFMYDPKYKQKLPYYDGMPLVLPLADNGKTFTGLNLHYLPPNARAKVMDIIYKSDSSKVLGYIQLLSKSAYFAPSIKQYLKTHVKSKFQVFDQEHWEIAIYLPVAHFQKATQQVVYQNTGKMIADHNKKNKKKKK